MHDAFPDDSDGQAEGDGVDDKSSDPALLGGDNPEYCGERAARGLCIRGSCLGVGGLGKKSVLRDEASWYWRHGVRKRDEFVGSNGGIPIL